MCGKNKPYSHSVSFVTQSECLIDTNINREEKPTAIIHIESQKLWILKLHNELILEEKKFFVCFSFINFAPPFFVCFKNSTN